MSKPFPISIKSQALPNITSVNAALFISLNRTCVRITELILFVNSFNKFTKNKN